MGSMVSLGACPDVVRHVSKQVEATQTTENHLELDNDIWAKWTSLLHHLFTFIFGVSLMSPLYRVISFSSITLCGIILFLIHHLLIIRKEIQDHFPPFRSDGFSKCSSHFFEQC